MSKNITFSNAGKIAPKWLTIREAVKTTNKLTNIKINDGDTYRHALYGNISLSIYFQSPVILKKVKTSNFKTKLHPMNNSLLNRLCMLDRNCFINGRALMTSTEGKFMLSNQRVIDTALKGYEYVLIQRLLAHCSGSVIQDTSKSC
ncbi:hypothetical protein [Lonsdalea quercina]|uniref:hypothetical protein n=1 Tax=Lonsdalea quercina TaxID=71657 RepID=UPI0039748942